jgi:hypothetical protein
MPLYPEMLRIREGALKPYPSTVFIFGLAVESIKEFGGVSHLHFNSEPLHFQQIEHLVRCINCYFVKIIFIESTMQSSLVVF